MHEAEPRGSLRINDRGVTSSQLALLAGAPMDEVAALLNELEAAGVFSRDDEGIIFSRRMVRDEAKFQKHRSNGKRGGNPLLLQAAKPQAPRGGKAQLNPGVNPRVKAQRPDTRYQSSSSLRSEERAGASSLSPKEFDAFWNAYPNKVAKAAAREAFAAARRRVDAISLMNGLARYRAKLDERPWCNPATWLNQDRWSDEPAPPLPGPPPNAAFVGRRRTAADVLFAPTLERLNGHDRDTEPSGSRWPAAGQLPRFGD
ncbi:hypothetical protein [Devosia sp. CN2-171]|uniref:hypothetical protein n=1 Tax=Devosia sp. CN2-171 TaxID=3400909 RepID=UPI003BF8CD09